MTYLQPMRTPRRAWLASLPVLGVSLGAGLGGCGAGRSSSTVAVVAAPVASTAVAVPPATPAPKPTGGCPTGMASLPGGTFHMGERGVTVTDETGDETKVCSWPARDGTPQQCTLGDSVTVQPFCLDLAEVTVDAYASCVRAGRCKADHLGEMGNDARSLAGNAACNYGASGKGDHPINCVDWEQADGYCRAQDRRLPTEEEWEWAARGGSQGRTFPWGEAAPDSQLCFAGPAMTSTRKGTCPVGAFVSGDAPGAIHDLAGNVWEWTSSLYDASDTSRDGSGRVRALDRVHRGGGWRDRGQCSASVRYPGSPSMWRRVDIGFRCAR
jgi:sulfatase modifying factor 1